MQRLKPGGNPDNPKDWEERGMPGTRTRLTITPAFTAGELELLEKHARFSEMSLEDWLLSCLNRGVDTQMENDRDAGFDPAGMRQRGIERE